MKPGLTVVRSQNKVRTERSGERRREKREKREGEREREREECIRR